MRRRYSIYEAKARLSEIIRDAREGRSAVITYHGEPVAEVRPFTEPGTLQDRIDVMETSGLITPAEGTPKELGLMKRRRGALARFLRERD